MRIDGLDKLVSQIRERAAKALASVEKCAVVGYTAVYALWVHEDMEAKHPVGQAKFLEQPAREMSSELAAVINDNMRRGRSLDTSLLMAALRLQRESMQLVPVDTGALRASAFSRIEEIP